MIIGPAIRKMREENEKKKMPMASAEESEGESVGLRVGPQAWKWPSGWPYDPALFLRPEEEREVKTNVNPVDLVQGKGIEVVEEDEKPPMDHMTYWAENKEETVLTPASTDRLAAHYAFYLSDGMDVLELGAAENSYLPEGLTFGRHVGIGADAAAMAKNERLTESMVVDLNKVVEEQEMDSDEIRKMGINAYDVILMANTIDFLTNPREVFKTCWRLLKPGGIMLVSFTAKDAYSDKFAKAQTKMWTNFNDDQHMWVTGSFFQFSAGAEGWENLKGFDVSPEDAKKDEGPFNFNFGGGSKPLPMYVVQATKATITGTVDEKDPEKSFKQLMALQPTLEERDKMLVAPRLARAWLCAETEDEKRRIVENVDALPAIYESLVKMDQFAFPFDLQAQLAANLCTDTDFVGNEVQIENMKMGLGLSKPSESFWKPMGAASADMEPEEKVNILSHIVPRFGNDHAGAEAAIESFLSGIPPTIAVIKEKAGTALVKSDVQLAATELLAAEILKPGRSTRKQFAQFLGELTEEEIREVVKKRKAYKEMAAEDMEKMQVVRKQMREEQEARLKAEQEERERARRERSTYFDEKTGRFLVRKSMIEEEEAAAKEAEKKK